MALSQHQPDPKNAQYTRYQDGIHPSASVFSVTTGDISH